MDNRQQLAAMFLQGMLSNSSEKLFSGIYANKQLMAKTAVEYADELLEELTTSSPKPAKRERSPVTFISGV